MNSPETQPAPDSGITYVDPEQIDTSEQQFAVSLEQRPDAPAFVIEPEEALSIAEAGPSTYPQSNPGPRAQPEAKAESVFPGSAAEISAAAASTESSCDWRDLVSEKVTSYRSRRPHKERYPSLQLQFDVEPQRRPRTEDIPAFDAARDVDCPLVSEVPAMRTASPVLLESTARVLEFPRPAAAPVRIEELAEPVVDRPRIIEAPELLPPPPAMGGILIEAPAEPAVERRPRFEVPLQSATLHRRALAALADAAIVASATVLFGYIALRVIGMALPWRTEAESCAGILIALWAAYQCAFLVLCGKTPGLLVTRLEIKRFEGAPASRNLRRWRALASLLSMASLGLGYAWCFLDEDQLSWHDRITRTHLALRDPGR